MTTSLEHKIISEETLEKLVCSNCNNYLSYGKPKIGSQKIICGRCNQEEAILPLFNENITNYLFPCRNRFDNCKELLEYSHVEEHEKNCKQYATNKCPECRYKGNGCQLYHHFIKLHPDHVLKYPIFNIRLWERGTRNFLYRVDNSLFFVKYQIAKPGSALKLSMQSIGDVDEAPQCQIIVTSPFQEKTQYLATEFKSQQNAELDIPSHIKQYKHKVLTCRLKVKSSSGDLFIFKNVSTKDSLPSVAPSRCTPPSLPVVRTPNKTERIQTIQNRLNAFKSKSDCIQSRSCPKCLSSTLSTPSNETISQSNENQQLKQVMLALNTNLFPKLICSNCGCYVIPPIYRCSLNHVRCEDCNSSFCSTCNDIVNWSRATDLEVFHDIIPLPCRWDCKMMLLSSELREHEKKCTKRQYKCIEVWCTWRGDLSNLVKHWHSSIKIYSSTHQVYGFCETLVEFYLIHDYELFYRRMDPLTSSGRNIHIRKVSDVCPPSQVYVAKVVMMHKCDGTVKEKIQYVTFGGITLLKKMLFTDFGQCKHYKIIFSVALISETRLRR